MNLYFRLVAMLLGLPLRGRIQVWDTAVLRFRVLPTDLDTLGHMNNARYFAFLDQGRVDLLLRAGFWRRISAQGWYPVVSAQTMRYRRSLQPGQKFTLHTRILGFDERSTYYEHEFRVREEVYARCVAQSRMLRKGGGRVDTAELLTLLPDAPDLELPEWVTAWAETVRTGL